MIESYYISPSGSISGSIQSLSGGTIGIPVLERVMMTLRVELSVVEELDVESRNDT